MRPRVLYHALGGGLGHATRALAVARRLAPLVGGAHRLHVNTPFAPAIRSAVEREPGLALHAFPPAATAAEVAGDTLAFVRDWRPDLLVVDTFPRGVGGELAGVLEAWSDCPRALISRGLPAGYVHRFGLIDFVRRHYDLILAPGEPSPFAGLIHGPGGVRFEGEGEAPAEPDGWLKGKAGPPGSQPHGSAGASPSRCASPSCFEMLPPFLVRDREEMLPVDAALSILQAHEPVALVVGSGSPQECREWERIAADLAAQWPPGAPPLRLALPPGIPIRGGGKPPVVRHFPLAECLRGVLLLIGAAGYHLVHEARSAGTAGLFAPSRRQYDDQAGRLRDGELMGENLLQTALARLREPPPVPSTEPNGARLAAGRLAGLIRRERRSAWDRCW
jgi:hypothetical protein